MKRGEKDRRWNDIVVYLVLVHTHHYLFPFLEYGHILSAEIYFQQEGWDGKELRIWDLDAMNNFKNNQTLDVRIIFFPFFHLSAKGNSRRLN